MTGETSNMCDSNCHVINTIMVSIMVEPEHFYKMPSVLDDESIEERWNQVNFMVMSYDAVGRQPIGT